MSDRRVVLLGGTPALAIEVQREVSRLMAGQNVLVTSEPRPVAERKEVNMNPMKSGMALAAMSALFGMGGLGGSPLDNMTHRNGVPPRKRNPWDNIDLTKAERRGKTYEQIQELRAKRWLELNTDPCPMCGGQGSTPEHDPSLGAHDADGSCNGSCPIEVPCDKCEGRGRVKKGGR